MSARQPDHVFDEVQIARGLRPLAQHGYVVIDRGTLSLLGSDQQPIASAPLAEVEAAMARFQRGKSLVMTVNGTKYNVSPGWGARGLFQLPGDAAGVKTAAEALLKLVEAGKR